MIRTTFSTLIIMFLFCGSVSAKTKKPEIATIKAKAIANLELKIKHLLQTKRCVEKVKTEEDIKKCRLEARKKGEAIRAKYRSERRDKKTK